MDIFQTHARIVADYENYIASFLNISDPVIRQHVEKNLKDGKLWPEPLIQFNPAFKMLELLLTRMRERTIRDAIYANLRFLVFDELHTYRGRQGADVAMLIRRIRSKCIQKVVSIGTSATMVSAGDVATQKDQVAKVATSLFGRKFSSAQIVNEILTRSLGEPPLLPTQDQLAQAISAEIKPEDTVERLKTHPVAIWLENRIALDTSDIELRRGKPQPLSQIIEILSADSSIDPNTCRKFLIALLQWISQVNQSLQDAGQRYILLPE